MTTPKPERYGVYWAFAWWNIALGVVLECAPESWFGPSWHFFTQLPGNGFWMGLCCTMLGAWQLLSLWHGRQRCTPPGALLAVLFFLSGFVFWTSGMTLAAAGLLGHQGLMEAPFMCYAGAHMFAYAADLMARARAVDSEP